MAKTLYLIDGMAFAFRAFYAIRASLSDSKGRPTNAVYGFTRVLLKLLREENPTHVAVAFDAPGKTFREELYDAYKATRPEAPQEFKDQIPRMYEVVEALNIPLIVAPGVEADDVLGTLAGRAAAEGMDVVLVTGDKDMLQLVGDRVRVYDPQKGDTGKWYGPEEVEERFGTRPAHVIDALALIGDSSDNVPGVRGIGEKTAKKLMARYASLEGLYEHLEDLKGKQKEKVEEDREQAFFSRELVRIKTDVALEVAPAGCVRTEPDADAVVQVFTDLGFHTLIDEVVSQGALQEATETTYRLVATKAELKAALEEMRAAGSFAVDTETTSLNPMEARLVGVSMSCRDGEAYYVPVGHAPEALAVRAADDELFPSGTVQQIPFDEAVALMKPLFEDTAVGKAGHNIKYDLLVLRNAGIELAGVVMDTMVASYLTDPSRLRHNLDEVSLQYLRHKPIPISELIGKGAKAITFDFVPVDRACEYACEDADLTWRLSQRFRELLRARELERLFTEVELPLIAVLAEMERAGIAINKEVFDTLHEEIEARLAGLEAKIFELAGEPFNINSPKQLQHILFDKLGLKPVRKTKTGYSTDVDVLEQLSAEHALPEQLLEYRMLEKLRGTYVDALPKLVNPATGRIHTSFNQAVTATGRLSSSEPNLQNIPVRTEYGRRIRAGFVPGGRGKRLISADYSQIELRILAHLSEDAHLRKAFFEDKDIHRDTASRVFGVSPGEVTPLMRRQAKAVNFGVVYGISAHGLARNIGVSRGEAADFIDAYFKQYPKVRQWLDTTIEEGREHGYVTTLLLRRRYLPELASSDGATRRAAERAAINMPVQGTAADVIKLAMVRLDAPLREYGAQMLLQVHDELVVETPEDSAGEAAALMVEIMEGALDLEVPLKVDVGIGRNWSEIH